MKTINKTTIKHTNSNLKSAFVALLLITTSSAVFAEEYKVDVKIHSNSISEGGTIEEATICRLFPQLCAS